MALRRNIAGMVAGIVGSQAAVFAVEMLGTTLYPPPDATDSADPAALAAWFAAVPVPLKLWIAGGWLLGGVAGPWLALRIAGRRWSGWAITAVFLVGSIVNLTTLPHPLWMQLCGIAFPLLGGWIAQRLRRRRRPDEARPG